MRRTPVALIICLPLAALGAWFGSLGWDHVWLSETGNTPLPYVSLAIAASLHAAWLVPAFRRDNPILISLGWIACVWAGREGLIAEHFADITLPAIAVETIALAIALSAGERVAWADRLSRWRRARQNIATQLRMSEGVFPWLKTSAHRLVTGAPDRPAGAAFDRLTADLADAEQRLQLDLARLALPEHVRQSMITAAHALVSRAEVATAQVAITLERQALEEAAACRDQIGKLSAVPAPERERLAAACEGLMLDLVHLSRRPAAQLPRQAPSGSQ